MFNNIPHTPISPTRSWRGVFAPASVDEAPIEVESTEVQEDSEEASRTDDDISASNTTHREEEATSIFAPRGQVYTLSSRRPLGSLTAVSVRSTLDTDTALSNHASYQTMDQVPRLQIHQSRLNVIPAAALCLPALIAAILWTSLMLYFLFYFLNLPPGPHNTWPHIENSYAGSPFISSIGGIRRSYFAGFSGTVAALVAIAYVLDFVRRRFIHIGHKKLLAKLIFGCLGSMFLVCLSTVIGATRHHQHLVFTGLEILCMGSASFTDFLLAREWSQHIRNETLDQARRARFALGAVAIPTAFLVMIGVYGCSWQSHPGDFEFSQRCYSLVSFAAVSEWILALCWVGALITMTYEAIHMEEWCKQMKAVNVAEVSQQAVGLAEPSFEDKWYGVGPRAIRGR